MVMGRLGEYLVRIDIAHEKEIFVFRTKPIKMVFDRDNRHRALDLPFEIQDWKINEPGVYDCHLVFNHKSQAIWPLVVRGE